MSTTTRFCSQCGQSVAPGARFCGQCGLRLNDETPGETAPAKAPPSAAMDEFSSRETQRLAAGFFERQLELIRGINVKAEGLLKDGDEQERVLLGLEASAFSPERTQAVQAALMVLDELGERWEDLQHEYNRESESLEEEFLDQAAELEVDLEMPVEIQDRIQSEINTLTATFDRIQDRLSHVGAKGNLLIQQPEGRHFGAAALPAPGFLEVLIPGLAGLAGFTVGWVLKVPIFAVLWMILPLLLAALWITWRWRIAARI